MRSLFLTSYLFCLLLQHTSSISAFIQGKSFSVTSSISLLTTGNELHGNLQFFRVARESYSTFQKRAQIELYLDDYKSNSNIFFLDTKDHQEVALELNGRTLTCRSTDIRQIKSHLLLDSKPIEAIDTQVPNYIIGPAKLLYFIEAHKSQFQLKNEQIVEGRRVTSYFLKYLSTLNDEPVKVETFYEGSGKDVSEIPIRITLISGNTSILIHYADFSLINSYLSISEHKNSYSVSSDVWIDKFAFPPVESCINLIYSAAKPIFDRKFRARRNAKFSFDAHLITKSLEERKYRGTAEFNHIVKVSYDGNLDALLYREEDRIGVFKQLLNFRRLRMYQALDELSSNSSSRCVVTKIPKPEPDLTIGDLIVGSNYLLDLGKSRVRGIPCRVYFTRLKTLPYWIEQPIKFKTSNEASRIRSTDRGKGYALLHVNEQDLSPVRLVIYQEKTYHLIRFYNFVWDLDHSIKPSQHFTLENVCSLSNEERFKVDIAIVNDLNELVKYSKDEIENELLRGFQDNLGLPINMVYQLETKLQLNAIGHDMLLSTFRVSAQSSELAEPVYLGQGYANPGSDQRLYQLPLRSFQLCLWLAATRGNYFGYNAPQRFCVIDISDPDPSDATRRKPPSFVMDPVSKMEIYQANVSEDPLLKLYWASSRWEDEKSRQMFIGDALRNRIVLFERPQQIEFINIMPVGADTSESHLISGEARRYDGFGLKDEKPNKLIEIATDDEGISTQMSYEKCHLACVSNFRCQTFSLCLRSSRTECVISPLTFKGANMTALLDKAGSSSLNRRTIKVTLNDGFVVELNRHFSCALYRKDILELFKKKESNTVTDTRLTHQNFLPTSSIEDCAKSCVDKNFEILSKDMGLTAQLGGLINPASDEFFSNQAQIQALMKKHKSNLNGFCFNFYFFEKGLTKDSNSIKRFCSIGARLDKETNATINVIGMELKMYQFRMELFYESQAGIRLNQHQLPSSEGITYVKLKEGKMIDNEKSYANILRIVEDGNNLQEFWLNDELECAKACFTQSMGPWPSCRSFDVSINLRTSAVLCMLNSMTLRQAYSKKPNLIISESTRIIKVKHYEPILGLALDESLLDETLHLNIGPPRLSDLYTLDLFLMTCTLCLAFVTSLAATCFGLRIMHQKREERELLSGDGE